MHQVSASVLHSLIRDAYCEEHVCEKNVDDDASFPTWVLEKAEQRPTFKYWLEVLNLQIILLTFVRAIRLGDFQQFLHSLKKMVPWYFAMNYHNYARWVTVHIKNKEELKSKAPMIHGHFSYGKQI